MFCRIYTTGEEKYKVIGILSEQLRIPITNEVYIENSGLFTIYFDTNEEHNIQDEKKFPDGFLHFKTLIEIDFPKTTEIDYAVVITNSILSALWKLGCPAVASCSFENKLMHQGGYNNRNLPWIE
jgi:hypothetical protein